ncbi:hypothetical protein [Natranaerofaba carboxydovora]|uniref:hypothetical protein n=1 Tax=Natranaerofaba carboxydovora TaxID=2742683 RepID=UPI001F131B19|nr:hypothetical protein [Natranaerofaba carboxydovora]UMZ74720.1 hypothetical protein ACONDI_02320 [Natranaerofaba carboxydovora]
MENNYIGYRYVKINSIWFYYDQNLLRLGLILFFKGKPFFQKGNNLKSLLIKTISINKILFSFLLVCTKFKKLPVKMYEHKADLVIEIQTGLKYFDLKKEIVHKRYHSYYTEKSIKNEIERITRYGKDFAPPIINYNLSKKQYTEKYINGVPLSYDYKNMNTFNTIMIELLGKLVKSEELITVKVNDLISSHEQNIKCLKKHIRNKYSKKSEFNDILHFQSKIASKLKMFHNDIIYMSISHGDLNEKHVLYLESQKVENLKILDWESTKYRTCLFDLTDLFLRNYVRSRSNWKRYNFFNLLTQLDRAREYFIIQYIDNCKEHILNNKNLYRWLYFIERIDKIVEFRELNEHTIKVLLNFVRAFEAFDKIEGDI